ncbi:ATP-binding protein [Alteromonas halophila]|uniref:Novel STAND NTPase 1 domain-containing protein n=1 Tax=Alteromonas halophila TaxID=516698 RepID=A0A918JGV9_9ALTE|nr:ATP-binding protein [Alteromonas halophila]GGW79441.1 hypothetical protein GCM10007391_10270 [Alteromonas halophila]
MHTCNLFVSSPGDVALERTLIAGVVERLRRVFGHRSKLTLTLWEELPLEANTSFQPQLPDPATMDIFILILWQRMGTPLPQEAIPPTFKGPMTGTEFEFFSALKAQQQSGQPSIMVYRRMDNAGKYADEVNAFFATHFVDDSQCVRKAFHTYATIAEFESLAENHLYRWLDSHLPHLSEKEMIQERQWYSGNPFQGLKAFRFEHASVFCGRNDAIAEALEKLKVKMQAHQPFLLIVGMSGSGKSSVARAGVLPALYNAPFLPRDGMLGRGVMCPADVEGDPFKGLVAALSAQSAGSLVSSHDIPRLAKLAAQAPDDFISLVDQAMANKPPPFHLVLLIDQLEELYISAAIDGPTQKRFSTLIKRLVESLHIIVVATLRSDCYHLLGGSPAFMAMKQQGGQLDLTPPTLFNLRQMITIPAHAARLHFEAGEHGQPPLDEVIAESAACSPESLPLLEFTLSQLYESRTPSGMLTFKQYNALGGIEGAIASHAEAVFSRLSDKVQRCFASVFNQLINGDTNQRYLRKWVSHKKLNVDVHAGQLVAAFLAARLLVSERNPDNVDVVALAHESLFIHWPRLVEWLKVNRSLLNIRNRMSGQGQRWLAAGKDPALLLNRGKPLEDGKALLNSDLTLDEDLKRYVNASLKRVARARRLQYAAIVALFAITLIALGASYFARQNQLAAERNLAKSQDLIEYLIDDLHSQLEKVGRLDVMQSIGEKVMDYFASMAPTETTADSLRNRTKALYQIGSVYMELDAAKQAVRAFQQSLEQARALTRQTPDKYTFVFEQAQAEFWLGYAYWSSNELDRAEAQFISYRDTATRLVALRPDSPSAMMEVAYAYSNLGTLADTRGEIDEAIQNFLQAAATTVKVVALTPSDMDAIATLADIYSWLGSAHEKQLKLTQALSFYRSEQKLFSRIQQLEPSYQSRVNIVLANNRLAKIELFSGNVDNAIATYQDQLASMQQIVDYDRNNRNWQEILSATHAGLGEAHILAQDLAAAQYHLDKSFAIDPEIPQQSNRYWRSAFYQRHYWYWRLLIAQTKYQQAKSYERDLFATDDPTAQLWQMRIASYRRQSVDALPDTAASPYHLVALLEQALLTQRTDVLMSMVARVPPSLWNYPELVKLKPGIDTRLTSLPPARRQASHSAWPEH